MGEGRLLVSRLTLLDRLSSMAPRELPLGVTAFLLGWRGLTAVNGDLGLVEGSSFRRVREDLMVSVSSSLLRFSLLLSGVSQ